MLAPMPLCLPKWQPYARLCSLVCVSSWCVLAHHTKSPVLLECILAVLTLLAGACTRQWR